MAHFKSTTMAVALALALPCAAAAEEAPGTFKIPGTDTTLKLYGYAQLDATFDLRGRDPNVEGDDWAHVAALVPLDNTGEARNKKNQLYLTARTSRFGIQTATPTRIGEVGVRFEGDFNGANLESGQSFTNSVLFRIRHAYGTVSGSAGTLLVGQTWSTFLDLGSVADTVDFNGPGSIALVRNPMIRYTLPLAPGVTLALAAENAPGTDGDDFGEAGGGNRTRVQTIPDFHANLGFAGSWGSFSVRGLTINYKQADSATNPTGTSNKQGYGLAASGSLKFLGDTLVAHVAGGGGIGRYLFGAIANPRFVQAGNELFLTDALAYHAGYTHVWSPQFRSNLIASQTFFKENTAAGRTPGANKRIDEAFVNTFWTFAKNAEFGLEYVLSQRHTFADQVGTQSRITSTFHYNFF
jgi:hypothetical protein